MEIYLMQHGLALPKEKDPEEGLSEKGTESIHISGKALKKMGISFDKIVSSPKQRAKQTAAIIAQEVNVPLENIIETEKVKAMEPSENSIAFLAKYSDKGRILITGHLPSLAKIASALLSDHAVNIAFSNGGCCLIEIEDFSTHLGKLKWYLTPDQLRLIASANL